MRKKQATISKRERIRIQRARRQRQQRLTTLLMVGAVALVIAGLLIYPSLRPAGKIVTITPRPRPQADFNATGDPNAPVKIEIYSDYQCPACKKFFDETELLIVDNYVAAGKVYYKYIPYGPGGTYIGQESRDAAMASFCAGEQGKFWDYHDILFANHTGENVGDYTEKRLMKFAEALALDINKFRSCYNSAAFDNQLLQGIQAGKQANLTVTPSFLINGKLLKGAIPYSVFQQEIEAALAAAGG